LGNVIHGNLLLLVSTAAKQRVVLAPDIAREMPASSLAISTG